MYTDENTSFGASHGELLCQIYTLWKDVQETRQLSSESIMRFRSRYTNLAREIEATIQPEFMTQFLQLPNARITELEALLELFQNVLPRIKRIAVPSAARSAGWSMQKLQTFVDFARRQTLQLHLIPHRSVPADSLYDLKEKQNASQTNQAALSSLLNELSSERAAQTRDTGPDLIPESSLMHILVVARRTAESILGVQGLLEPGFKFTNVTIRNNDDQEFDLMSPSVLVVSNYTVGLAHSSKLPPEWDPVRLLHQPRKTSIADNSFETIVGREFGRIDYKVEDANGSTVESALSAYTEEFFTVNHTWEETRFFAALMAQLVAFAEALVRYYQTTFADVISGEGESILPPARAVVKVLLWVSSFWSGAGAKAAEQHAKASEAQIQNARKRNLDIKNLQQRSPKEEKVVNPTVPYTELATNSKNVALSAFSFLFAPRLLKDFFEATINWLRNDSKVEPPQLELARLFAPFFAVSPPNTPFEPPKFTMFTSKSIAPGAVPTNPILARHWIARAGCEAVDFVAFNDRSITGTRRNFATKLEALGSQYPYSMRLRKEQDQLSSVPALEPEIIEVLLLKAMIQKFEIVQQNDIYNEFNLAKQAFTEYTSWASKTSPTADYFQARPCELLRVRALDLSSVPELTSGIRGVRVFMPVDASILFQSKPANERVFADYLRIAQQTLSPYLLNVLQDSAVFKQLWISLVDLYVMGTDTRENFMKRCSQDEEGDATDISFD